MMKLLVELDVSGPDLVITTGDGMHHAFRRDTPAVLIAQQLARHLQWAHASRTADGEPRSDT
jgi:hypothetical protein